MLMKGGNAVDAVLATAITLTVVEPTSNGIGSDAFCILWDGKKLHGLNASGRSPAGVDARPLQGQDGDAGHAAGTRSPFRARCPRGSRSRSASASCRSPISSSRRSSTRPTASWCRPTIARLWARQAPSLAARARASPKHSCRAAARPAPGEQFRVPAQAKTLKRIAETKGEAFYKGDLAEKMAAHAQQHGGALTRGRSRGAHAWTGSSRSRIDYRGYTLHEIPPNGQGIAAQIALGILEDFDIAALPVDSADSLHLQIEAMKLAFADVYEHVSDADTMRVRNADLLDKEYLQEPRPPDRHEEGENAAARRARPRAARST